MQRCPVCEGLLEESSFGNGDSICRICCSRLKEENDVEYEDAGQKTIRQGYTDLMLAIKKQAYIDAKNIKYPYAVQEWEEFWLKSEPWPRIWNLLKLTVDQGDLVRNDLQQRMGGTG